VGWLDTRVPPRLGQERGWVDRYSNLIRPVPRSEVKSMVWITPEISFRWVAPPLQAGVVGSLSSTGCMIPEKSSG
jgi:hypothetical protein